MIRKLIFVAAVLLATQGPVCSHEVEKGPNGGQVVDAKGHHVEFTTKDSAIVIYLTDEKSAPIPSAGAEGKAIVQDGGKSATVALAPSEPNVMTGKLDTPLNAGAKIVVAGKLPDGHEILARFVVK